MNCGLAYVFVKPHAVTQHACGSSEVADMDTGSVSNSIYTCTYVYTFALYVLDMLFNHRSNLEAIESRHSFSLVRIDHPYQSLPFFALCIDEHAYQLHQRDPRCYMYARSTTLT
jgi:hypothetical protein